MRLLERSFLQRSCSLTKLLVTKFAAMDLPRKKLPVTMLQLVNRLFAIIAAAISNSFLVKLLANGADCKESAHQK